MGTIKLNTKIKNLDSIAVDQNILFNMVLGENIELVRRVIKSIYPLYKIRESFLEVINKYIDYEDDGSFLYAGLIVRVDLDRYVILYLEGCKVNFEYALNLIKDYISLKGDYSPSEIDVDKFVVSIKMFNKILSKLK